MAIIVSGRNVPSSPLWKMDVGPGGGREGRAPEPQKERMEGTRAREKKKESVLLAQPRL